MQTYSDGRCLTSILAQVIYFPLMMLVTISTLFGLSKDRICNLYTFLHIQLFFLHKHTLRNIYKLSSFPNIFKTYS